MHSVKHHIKLNRGFDLPIGLRTCRGVLKKERSTLNVRKIITRASFQLRIQASRYFFNLTPTLICS